MKLETTGDGQITLKEVYTGIRLVSDDQEEFAICMRDSGFEFKYDGNWWEAKGGYIRMMGAPKPGSCASDDNGGGRHE